MNQLIQLAEASFTNNQLDQKKVTDIAENLDRKTLKAYIRALKLAEKKRNVYIDLPHGDVYNKSDFAQLFGDKNIIIKENPDLLLGMRITDNDMIHNYSLQNTLHQLIRNIKE